MDGDRFDKTPLVAEGIGEHRYRSIGLNARLFEEAHAG
jgi:hypothetical protein